MTPARTGSAHRRGRLSQEPLLCQILHDMGDVRVIKSLQRRMDFVFKSINCLPRCPAVFSNKNAKNLSTRSAKVYLCRAKIEGRSSLAMNGDLSSAESRFCSLIHSAIIGRASSLIVFSMKAAVADVMIY